MQYAKILIAKLSACLGSILSNKNGLILNFPARGQHPLPRLQVNTFKKDAPLLKRLETIINV
jgi:hypothetical protein